MTALDWLAVAMAGALALVGLALLHPTATHDREPGDTP